MMGYDYVIIKQRRLHVNINVFELYTRIQKVNSVQNLKFVLDFKLKKISIFTKQQKTII